MDGATFVDFEQGLNSAVNKLRQTLGDSADQPRYIETVAGRGYRFVAPLQRSAVVKEMPAPSPLRIEPRPSRPSRWPMAALGVLAIMLLAGGAYWSARRSSSQSQPAPGGALRFAVQPPEGFAMEGAASRQSFALSPDGSKLAFTAMDSSEAFSLFVRDANSLLPRRVPGTDGAHALFWPADGRSVYVTAKGKFWRVPLEGQPPVLLSDSPMFMFSGAWLSPERLLLDAFRESYSLGSSGGTPRPLNNTYRWPQLLPGGEYLLCLMRNPRTGRRWARVVRSSDFTMVKDLFEATTRVQYVASSVTPETGYILNVRAGILLARPFDPRTLQVTGEAAPVARDVYHFAPTGAADFSVSARGTIAYHGVVSRTHLAWVDRTGRELGTIGPANANLKAGRLSPDGKMLAAAVYDLEHGQQDLWIFDVVTNSGRRLSPAPALRDAAAWSPDSKKIAFARAIDETPPRVHVRGLGASDVEEILPAAAFQFPVDWSADGRLISFMNTGFPRFENERQSDVSAFDLDQGQKIQPLLSTLFHEAWGSFSPDGKWLAFTSNESGRGEVYLQALRRGDAPALLGPRHLVSRSGATSVRWRRDGRELFFLDHQGRMQAVPIAFSPQPVFGPAKALFTVSTGARAAIHALPGFDVSADGNRFVIPVVSRANGPSVVVIQNWEALLPEKSH